MRVNNINSLSPTNDNVITKVLVETFKDDEIISVEESGSKRHEEDKTRMYFGEVVSLGPETLKDKHCPNLNVNDKILFSEFAGHHISTNEKCMAKVIRGYDIMAILNKIKNITKDDVMPTADRLFISVFYEETTEDGLFISKEDSKDPTLKDLKYGVIIKKGPSCKSKLEVGQIVALDDYVGECVAIHPEKDIAEYRVLSENSVLFTV